MVGGLEGADAPYAKARGPEREAVPRPMVIFKMIEGTTAVSWPTFAAPATHKPDAEPLTTASNGLTLIGFLDRDTDQTAPFRPGAVVVAHLRISEQVLEHEPGV